MEYSEQGKLLAEQIEARRKMNIDGLEFVPYEWLSNLLTVDTILRVLSEGKIEAYEQRSIAEAVRNDDGLRTFATLVLIGKPDSIYNFGRSDPGFQKKSIDSKLPMKVSDLDGIFDASEERDGFVKKQFLFVIPIFPQGIPHRIYDECIRVPFLKPLETGTAKKKPPSGHFGLVSKEKLPPPEYGQSDDRGMTLVRKMLKTQGGNAYESELRCLRLLNEVRHTSILDLSGSYTQRNTHNFLFPEATGGDLHDLLREKDRRPQFREDEAMYLAICGLASALEQLHYYSNDDLQVELLGCHHDLKPRNILVHEDRFILADFGLALMAESKLNLWQLAEDRDLYFDAPERMDYTVPIPIRQEIGPPSDIWSFGAILAVLFAYMKGGPKEVERFKEKRQFLHMPEKDKPGVFLKSFHKCGEPHEGVEEWLSHEGRGRTRAEEELVVLIKDMLSIDPEKRPDIRMVLLRLRCITLMKMAEPVESHLQPSPEPTGNAEPLEYAVERQVFLEWLRQLGDTAKTSRGQFLQTDETFAHIYNTVYAIRREFQVLAQASRHDSPLFARLRRFNSQLLTCLDEHSQRSVRTVAELKVMPRARQVTKSRPTEASAKVDKPNTRETRPDENVRLLLSAENVSRLIEDSEGVVPKLDPDSVTRLESQVLYEDEDEDEDDQDGATEDSDDPGKVHTFSLGTLNENGTTTPVVIEELEIGPDFNSTSRSKTLFKSLENVLGQPPEIAARFRALGCAGIYHDEKRRTIGLVYRYPKTSVSEPGTRLKVSHLARILSKYPDPIDSVNMIIVTLDDRLRLAQTLATAVFEFHKMNWFHKNISSYNVLFFNQGTTTYAINDKDSSSNNDDDDDDGDFTDGGSDTGADVNVRKVNLDQPSLIGFSHSRPGDAEYSNKMHSADEALFAYRHPDYAGADAANLASASGYLAEYDYYGLGLVLLEIGLWNPLWEMVEVKSMERKKIRAELRRRWVPLLVPCVGEVYAKAVDDCLSGKLSRFGKASEKEKVDEAFERLVLGPLNRLVVKDE
ncbi:hypothetical protein F5Y01DRAFT_322630 [Xylaria sp. FL0043]|nr:hypothetical protein F5Y01DRAFT_322630 [Xylaria sp. FL0043]